MAVFTYVCGFEAQSAAIDGITLTGTASYSTTRAYTGTTSIRCNPGSGATGFVTFTALGGTLVTFSIYIATLPSVSRTIIGTAGSGDSVRLTSTGTLQRINSASTVLYTTPVLTTGQWHYIQYLPQSGGASVNDPYVDFVGSVSSFTGNNFGTQTIGFTGTEASAADIYFDDVVAGSSNSPVNDQVVIRRVALLVPTADSAKGTGWTNDASTTTNFWDATNNKPPIGIADTTAGTGLNQIRNATSNANSNYDATMTSYFAAGMLPNDVLLVIDSIVATGAPVVTSAKAGTVGVSSNPVIANIALAAGGTSGAFWSGVTAGTYPTGWKISHGTWTEPADSAIAVTLATAPVMRITQVTSSTRIAMVCFMGMYIAWAVNGITPLSQTNLSTLPQTLPQ